MTMYICLCVNVHDFVSMCMSLCLCVYVCVYVYMCICLCVYVYMCICLCVCVYDYVYMCIYYVVTVMVKEAAFRRTRSSIWEGLEGRKGRGNDVILL